jgi:AraC family transcriptional regulator
VRRLRLHRAAVELITGELPVPRVARRAGYGSQEAFTRAFKAAYGVPPARYRASFVPSPTPKLTEDAMDTTTAYHATIRETPALRVAALAHSGDYINIGSTFERLMAMAGGQGLSDHGRDRSVSTMTIPRPHRVRHCAPMRVSRCLMASCPAESCRCARSAADDMPVTLHVGPYAELHFPYTWLYGTWLPKSGEETADAPSIEEYLNDARVVPPSELRTEIWLPLR